MMHQRKYAGEILKRFEMEECNSTSTPAEPRLQLSKDADGKMNLEHCRTENQIADIMTKGVQVEVFRKENTIRKRK